MQQGLLWYKDAIIYQVHVRSFYDSSGDGIGDFRGLIQKLDYIQSLGVNTIWLLPFYPSPLKDGGYDIADFTGIHPSYGTLADFKKFVEQAHARGLRVITELVLNHTSSAHNWFQRARKSKPGSIYRDFYVWSDTPDKYADARIIFQDFEVSNWTYDHVAGAYYWHRFYSHQPDLNFENQRVQQEIFKVLDFWFSLGVDGFRLDAVPYLFEAEGTNCENLPETHEYLKKLRKYVDGKYTDRLLLAEANQWPDDASAYFGDGDECHMAFHFPVMPRLYMALRMEDRFPVVDILEQTPQIPDNCQWAIFLRNHDELTLEMVSDEERDYMYRAFASDPRKRINVGIRRRLFPLFGADRRSIELLNILLLSLPGTPVIYYGDEIGMGDNYYLGDRDGVRTPMQWSPDKNAGFSQTDPQRLFLPLVIDPDYHYTSVNVENQEKNPSSFLWWKRRVIAKRRKFKAFGRGSIHFVQTSNPKILAFTRQHEEETMLVVVNLSRYSQHVELDLSEFAGSTPVEAFSRNEFPVITSEPWSFSMQFKNYFWFELRKADIREQSLQALSETAIELQAGQWKQMKPELQQLIKERLFNYLVNIRWFRGDSRKLRDVHVLDVIAVDEKKWGAFILMVRLDMIESNKDMYVMPISLAFNNKATELCSRNPRSVIAQVITPDGEGVLYDGVLDKKLHDLLLEMLSRGGKLKGFNGFLEGKSGRLLKKRLAEHPELFPHLLASRHTNSSLAYGDKLFLKIYRNPSEGENTDVEILKNLTRHTTFKNIPAYLGRIDYVAGKKDPTSVGVLMDLIPSVGTAWEMAQTTIESFFDRVVADKKQYGRKPLKGPDDPADLFGNFFMEMVELLARRTAQMHQALASLEKDRAFAPEAFSLLYQKSLYQAFRTHLKRSFHRVGELKSNLPDVYKQLPGDLVRDENLVFNAVRRILETKKLPAKKIRIHGNYKLDKVLFTGKDYMIVNFEGELEHTLSVRRIKHCPLKDVASMLGSFHYALYTAYFLRRESVPADAEFLEPLLETWYQLIADRFTASYLSSMKGQGLVPEEKTVFNDLLTIYMLERSVRELRYFAEHEPEAVIIPLNMLVNIRDALIVRQ